MAQENTYVIETVSLTKVFPDWWGRPKVVAVDDLNLKVRPNEIYGFLGPNGSGKTTTIKMLLNLLYPSKGRAFIFNGASHDPDISKRIGYLPEESYLYKYLTARETLDFYGQIFGLPTDVRKKRIDTLLEMVGLSGMGNRQIGTFSKGMARRIGLAQALINDPDLLILDEPTSGMDPMGTRQMKDLFVELARRGKTVLLCSHLLADVEDVCDRIGILYGGKMQEEGPVRELLQQKQELQITTGLLSDEAIDKIQAIVQAEVDQMDVSIPLDKLESFFVRTVEKARQENIGTSGAEMGTGISGFLAEKEITREPSVLDKLVTAKVEPAVESVQGGMTEKPTQPVEPTKAKQDDELLSQLTSATVNDSVTETVEQTPPEQVVKEEPKKEVRKDILQDLINKKEGGDGTTDVPQIDHGGDQQDE